MELKLSHGLRLARGEVQSARAAAATVRAEANEVARRHREGELISLEDVHAAELRADAADQRYADARRRYEEKRAAFAPKFLERQAPASAELRGGLADVADNLDAVLAPALAIEAFSLANSLPATILIGKTRRLAAIARELRELAN